MKDELSLYQAQLTYKKRLEAVLAELRSQQEPLRKKAAELEKIMIRERKDVDRLEAHGVTAFFYLIAGKMDEKLDAERREYYAARAKYDSCMQELNAINQDIEATEEDLADLADCEEHYTKALEAKRHAVEAAGTPEGEALLKQEEQLTYLSAQLRELEEAIAAGTEALHTTADVMQDIESAKDWATIDLLGGGGFWADKAKHDKLDGAQAKIQQLQVQLQRFNKELSDVALRTNLQVSIDGMLRFSDFFFDGLLTDTTVLDRIKLSLHQVEQTREEILTILRQIHDQADDVRHRLSRIRQESDSLILNTELN